VHPLTGAITIRPGIAYLDNGVIGERFRALAEEVVLRRASLLGVRLR
jgi:hypothetical protein